MEQKSSISMAALAAVNLGQSDRDLVGLALKGSRQIAYDWQIDTGQVSFSGDFADGFAGIPLDGEQPQAAATFNALVHEEDRPLLCNRLRALLHGKADDNAFVRVELRLRDALLGWRWIEVRGNVVERAHNDRALRVAGTLSDIQERKRTEESLRRLAYYDSLTGLPNRFLFCEYLELALKAGRRHDSSFAVLFVDLDRFKEINDTLGHAAGDQALRLAASRFAAALRSSDKVARMGGDEFCILIEDGSDTTDLAWIAQKLLNAVSTPFQIGGTTCDMSASIGISRYPADGNDRATLLRLADRAMYRAKRRGKNCYSFHRPPEGREVVSPIALGQRSQAEEATPITAKR